MQDDASSTRNTLRADHLSISSKNMHPPQLTSVKLKRWLKMTKMDKKAQAVLISMICDTYHRINGDRLLCPHCPETPMNLEHSLECQEFEKELRDAALYTPQTTKNDKLATTDLFPHFCLAAAEKLQKTRAIARETFLLSIDDQTIR